MEIVREILNLSVSEKESYELWRTMSSSFKPIIYQVKAKMREKLEIPPLDLAFYKGDIFVDDKGNVLYYLIEQAKGNVEVGAVALGENLDSFESFKEKIVTWSGKGDLSWASVEVPSPRYDLIKEDADVLSPDNMEMDAALLLKDERTRNILKGISHKGTCFQEELLEGPEDFETPQIIAALEEIGLITREFYIFCRESNQQISKVSSLEALEEAKTHGFKCFLCGRLISEERIAPKLKCLPVGDKFSRPNYWLALYLLYVIQSVVPDISNLLYSTEKGGKIFDVFFPLYDRFIMFEIKDEPVQLEDIFMFLSRVSYYRPARAILVTSHLVPTEVKMYLKNYGKHPLTLVEGLDNLDVAISQSIQQIKEIFIKNLFARFSSFTEIDICKMAMDRFFGEVVRAEKEKKEELLKTKEIEVIKTVEIPTEETKEEVVEPVVEGMEEILPPPKEEEVTLEIEEDVSASIEEMRETLVEEDLSIEFKEALPMEVIPTEEIPIEVDTSEEDLEKTVKFILDYSEGEGVVGNIGSIEQEMETIKDIGFAGGVLIGKDGLPITYNFEKDVLDPEEVSAASTVIFDSILQTAKDLKQDKIRSMILEGDKGKIRIFKGEFLYLSVFDERKGSGFFEETGTLPGEVTLREAVLKKVLEDLDRTDGIKGTIIVGRDGLVIESQAFSEEEADSLAYFASLVVGENERYFPYLWIGKVHQILVRSGDRVYSLIPIEKEAILLAVLDPHISREVWQSRLSQAAQMVLSVLS